MEINLNYLKNRFENKIMTLIGNNTAIDQVILNDSFKFIISSYNEPTSYHKDSKRAYHNLQHIVYGLKELDSIPQIDTIFNKEDIAILEIAWLYHDVVYSTDEERKYNEIYSGQEAFLDLTTMGVSSENAKKVYDAIQMTTHKIAPGQNISPIGAYICDMDLSSLGSPYDQFLIIQNNIRSENSQYSDKDFYKESVKILRSFADREKIFHTNIFYKKHEKQSRLNIRQWLDHVRHLGYK